MPGAPLLGLESGPTGAPSTGITNSARAQAHVLLASGDVTAAIWIIAYTRLERVRHHRETGT